MSDHEIIEVGGVERHLGLRPTPLVTKILFRSAYEVVKTIPESDWKNISSYALVKKTLNQGSQGSCVGASGVQVMMIARERIGLPFVELSIGSLYGPINGGRDSGASLGDAFVQLQKVGCCSTATIPHSDWQAARRSSAWHEEAKSYRLDEGFLCDSVDQFVSGLQLGFAGQMGLSANNSFNPDKNGFVPGSHGSINHALVACGMLKDEKGRWWIEGWNSWGNWGLNGRFFYPVDYLPLDELWICRDTIVG